MSLPDPAATFEVYDAESFCLLAKCQPACEDKGRHRLTFSSADGNGALLTYYFGKGKREVVVRSGTNEGMTGQLGTHWRSGHREWTVD